MACHGKQLRSRLEDHQFIGSNSICIVTMSLSKETWPRQDVCRGRRPSCVCVQQKQDSSPKTGFFTHGFPQCLKSQQNSGNFSTPLYLSFICQRIHSLLDPNLNINKKNQLLFLVYWKKNRSAAASSAARFFHAHVFLVSADQTSATVQAAMA